MKKILSLLMAFALVISLTACGGSSTPSENKEQKAEQQGAGLTVDAIKQKGKLVVATNAEFAPYEFHIVKDGKDEIVGFDMDIAKALADSLGVELEIRDMDFDLIISEVQSGKADIAIAGITPTEEREKQVDFSNLYFITEQTVVVKKENLDKFKSEEDLKGKKIGSQLGSIQQEIASKIEGAEQAAYPSITSLIIDVQTNKIDALVLTKTVAEQYVKQHEDLAIAENIRFKEYEEGSAVALPKGSQELVDYVNEFIKKAKEDGTIDGLWNKNEELSQSQAM